MEDGKKIQFKLIDFHERTGSLQVLYYNDDMPDGVTFSINIPIVNGSFLSGDDLVNLINSFAPVDMFERSAAIRSGNLQSPLPDLPPSTPAAPTQPMLFSERQLFVMENQERVLFVRPLVQMRSFDIPVEII